ncbi:MAG TPA: hypothetical protein VHL31_10030 [Geminicoccus sp.]|jgi:hypothetical protein|nr:hypothetical protein [Geminicoccus sp.]HEX2526618.1 hypothetical protein [Geminicoccus sp.]
MARLFLSSGSRVLTEGLPGDHRITRLTPSHLPPARGFLADKGDVADWR